MDLLKTILLEIVFYIKKKKSTYNTRPTSSINSLKKKNSILFSTTKN